MNATIPLGEVVEIRGGGTPRRSVTKYWGGHIPWATPKDFKSTRLEATRESVTPEGVENSGSKVIPAGSVIVPTRLAVGKAAISTVDLAIDQDLKALLPKENVDGRFLLHFLLFKAKFLEDQARRTSIKAIKPSLLRSLEIPDLRLEEQRRIAAILDKADDIRCKRERTLAMVEKTVDAAFLDLFGDPAANPKNWPESALDTLGIVQRGLQDSWKRYELPLQKPCLRAANVSRNGLALAYVEMTGLTAAEFERMRLQSGDVLIAERHGTPDEIGQAMVWDGSISECVHQNHLIRFRADKSIVLPDYVSRMLNSKGGQRRLIAACRVMLGFNSISTGRLKELAIPVPTLELQQRFACIIRKYRALADKMECGKSEVVNLFASLSHRAFRGEL